MTETCSRCGRARPEYISDPTCTKGGYCNWIRDSMTEGEKTLHKIAGALSDLAEKMRHDVFNVLTIEPVPITVADQRWIQLRCHHGGEGSPLIVQLQEEQWEASRFTPAEMEALRAAQFWYDTPSSSNRLRKAVNALKEERVIESLGKVDEDNEQRGMQAPTAEEWLRVSSLAKRTESALRARIEELESQLQAARRPVPGPGRER